MQLVVHELETSGQVRQLITVGSKPKMVYAVRALLFRYLAPAGNLYVEIQDENGKKIATSATVSAATIGTGNYWTGYQRFLVTVALKANTSYYVSLKASGYTFSELAYIGWCNSWEIKNVFESDYDGAVGMAAPLGVQLWAYRTQNKGNL